MCAADIASSADSLWTQTVDLSAPSCPAAVDYGHILCQQHIGHLQAAASDSLLVVTPNQIPVFQALRAVAWCAGWRSANCAKGFGNNARCDEVLLITACEDAEEAGRKLGLTPRTVDSIIEAIHSSAWHCANSHFGHKADAEDDFQAVQRHWACVKRNIELHADVLTTLQKLVWCCCWCCANWRSGSDEARCNLKQEQKLAQRLGLSKKSPWAPHVTHRKCNREMAWKQKAANKFLFSNSLVAIADQGGLRHHGLTLQRCAKKCISALHPQRVKK